MAMPVSGAISFDQLRTEWGKPQANVSLGAYLKSAGIVSGIDTAPNVPDSGAISMSNFHSSANIVYTANGSGVFTGSTTVGTGRLTVTVNASLYSFDAGSTWVLVRYSTNGGGSWNWLDQFYWSWETESTYDYINTLVVPNLSCAPNSLRVFWEAGGDGWGGTSGYLTYTAAYFD